MYRELISDTRYGVWDLPPHGQRGWAHGNLTQTTEPTKSINDWSLQPNSNRGSTSTLNESLGQSHSEFLRDFALDGYPPSAPSGLSEFYNALSPTALNATLNHSLDVGSLDPQIPASKGPYDASYTVIPFSVNLAHNADSLTSSSSQESILGLPLVEEPESISGCIQYSDFVPALSSLACSPPWVRDQDTQASNCPLPRIANYILPLDSLGEQHRAESSLIQRSTNRSDGIVMKSHYPPNISAGGPSSFDADHHIAQYKASSFPSLRRAKPVCRGHPLYKESSSSISSICGWQNDDQTICGEMITSTTLPGHLAAHGIKDKSRDVPTRCQWAGCKRQKPMNRESIVRHIREVHMHLKRPASSISVRPLHSM